MDPELFSTLTNVAYLMGGFFDFVIFVAVIVVALTQIRPVDAGLAYAIAGLAALRFCCICGSRSISAAFDPLPFNDMNGAVPAVLTLFAFVSPLLTVSLWASLLFAVVRLRKRIQG